METLKQSDAMTRLAICAVVAAAAVYAGEKLCQGKGFPLWEKYGPWILSNKVQAIVILAAALYALMSALFPPEKGERPAVGETFEPVGQD